jgi:hypothetical protein
MMQTLLQAMLSTKVIFTQAHICALPMLSLLLLAVIIPTLAYATNESSYKYGYSSAFNNYKCATTGDCDMVSSQSPVYDLCVIGQKVTNTTACSDGYVNGWTAWCKTDTKDCLSNVLYGNFPDVNHVLKSSCLITTYARNATTGLYDAIDHYECDSYNPTLDK